MNKQIWNLYKSSERGQNVIALFSSWDEENVEDKISAIFNLCKEYLGGKQEEEHFRTRVYLVFDNILVSDLIITENDDAHDYFSRLIDNLEIGYVEENSEGELYKDENFKPFVKQKDYKGLCALTSEISLVLYYFAPDDFIPILFSERFDSLLEILDVLEIPLPDLPAKTAKRDRMLYYNDLNNAVLEFGRSNNLSIEETCACLYDFAIMLLEEEKEEELPEPTNIWLTGGSKEDFKDFLKEPKLGAKSVWTCNENTKRGDIVVMYVLAPHSCIQSIWRADVDGVYTPFNFYNSRIRIANGIVVPHITLNELKSDTYFSQLPIVRCNFQGVNGLNFSAKYYMELQRLLTAKGFDVSILPQLYSPDLNLVENLKTEKDVEEKLLIPLMEKLAYSESNWTRQLSQKAGRKEKAIPDFVFFPKGEIHFQNAPMIIEAKFDMSSSIERTKSYNQALSYARMMNSGIFGICDKDRIIIYKAKNGYFDRFKPIFEKHWQSLNDAETFSKLKKLIGKDVIEKFPL